MAVKRLNDSGHVEIYGNEFFWCGPHSSNVGGLDNGAWQIRKSDSSGRPGRVIKTFMSDGLLQCSRWFEWADNANQMDAFAVADRKFDGGEFSDAARPEMDAGPEPGGSDEACPTCGCEPGDGLTDGCDDPDGCGYYRAMRDGEDVGPAPGTGEYSDSIPRE
jgi:hypothetical protein